MLSLSFVAWLQSADYAAIAAAAADCQRHRLRL